MSLGLDLSESEAKIARAREHAKCLKAEAQRFADERHPYTCEIGKVDPNTGECFVTFVFDDTSELALGIIAGDIVHNLRCALDYIITALARKSGIDPLRRHQFPAAETLTDYEANVGTTVPAKGNLCGVTCGLDTVRRFQPFNPMGSGQPNPRSHPVWLISRFSNADKHRVIMQSWAELQGLRIHIEGGRITELKKFPLPTEWAPNIDFTAAKVTFFPPFPSEPNVQGNISMSVGLATPAFHKYPKGEAVPLEMFDALCDSMVEIVEVFKAL